MPRIKASSIEELRHRVNIQDVVETYVSLKRSGSSYKGLSPFNPEKTPSFYVHPDKGFFKCFSSGHGGDMFKFVMLLENLDFPEAVEMIANRFGVQLEYEEDGNAPETRSLRKQIFEIHEVATLFFRECFLSDDAGGRFIRDYWEKERQFSPELAEDFQIGYAPPEAPELLQRLRQKRFEQEALVKSGLFYGSDARRLRFRGRLVIPIRDIQGRVIAFTARQTAQTPQDFDGEKAKYLNSPETPIFVKKNMLFNLDRARSAARDTGRFLLVEGQLDALRCAEKGVLHAVAPQGSGLSEEQVLLLKRYAGGLDCLLDGDKAGRAAAMRVLPMALRCGMDIRFLPLEPGNDPDDLLRTGGREGFDALESRADTAMRFAVQSLLADPLQASAREKQDALRMLFEIIQQCPSAVMQDDFLGEISRLMALERASLERDYKNMNTRSHPSAPLKKTEDFPAQGLTTAEDELFLILLHHGEIAAEIAPLIEDSWIQTDTTRGRLLCRFLAEYREDLWPGIEKLHELLDDDQEHALAYAYLAREPDFENPVDVANAVLTALHKKHIEQQVRRIRHALTQSASNEDAIALIRQRQELREQLQQTPRLQSLPLE